MKLHSTVQSWKPHLVYNLPTGHTKLALWQTLVLYNLSALVLLVTTQITLDFGQEVLYTNHTTAFAPQFAFHVPVQAAGHIEHHPLLTFQRGIRLLQSYIGCIQLQLLILLIALSLGLLIL